MSQIVLDEQTFTQLEQVAQAQQLSANELGKQFIRERLQIEEDRLIQRELEHFRAQHPQLLKKYRGEFIAMYQGAIVDHDLDDRKLVLRIEQHFPDVIVLITQVNSEVEETYTLRSPRVTFS